MFADDNQQYGRVARRLGDGRFEVQCLGDGQSRMAHVCGRMWKRVWVAPSDLVLVSTRAFQDQKVDIVHKFTDDEERILVQAAEIPLGSARASAADEEYERGLQAIRDVHGTVRAGFLPSADEFGFAAPDELDDEL